MNTIFGEMQYGYQHNCFQVEPILLQALVDITQDPRGASDKENFINQAVIVLKKVSFLKLEFEIQLTVSSFHYLATVCTGN